MKFASRVRGIIGALALEDIAHPPHLIQMVEMLPC
jgi:hypothetical protein